MFIWLHSGQKAFSLIGRPYRIVDYLLLAGLVWEKNTVPGWKFTIVYEQANRLIMDGQCQAAGDLLNR